MRILIVVLLLLLGLLQYKLWGINGGIKEIMQTKNSIAQLDQENLAMQQRNASLAADVQDLKHGTEAIEERAREELGMVKQGEVFYQIVE